MEAQRIPRLDRRLDLAARAAWLYYIGNNTQDQIAAKLNVSRQSAQRLVSLAVSEKLIKFRVDHPCASGLRLAETLRERFALDYCDVVPADPERDQPIPAIAVAAAACLETFLAQRAPLVLTFSTGRTLRATIAEVTSMACPQHKIVSSTGVMSRDGRASPYEIVMRLAERTGAPCYPMPTPVVASTVEERRLLQTQRSFLTARALAAEATAIFLGIGAIAWRCSLHADGFVTDAELSELIDRGAVGELGGWAFDAGGSLIEGGTNDRVAGLALARPTRPRTIALGGGREKVSAIRAALRGRLISGLITDERTAAGMLAGE